MPDPAFEALLAPLTEDVCAEVRRRVTAPPLPAMAADLSRATHGGLASAGIAEGRGKPGWGSYVAEQRRTPDRVRPRCPKPG